jgi:GAF domain-containing protein
VSAWTRARNVAFAREATLAFGASIAFFALVAVCVASADSDLLVVALAVGFSLAIVAIGRFCGVAYAIPAAIAGLLAYDWYQFPPTHPKAFPDVPNLADLVAYLAVASVVGASLAWTRRRAAEIDVARSELATEQAAIRRVATLVARGVPASEVFDAVAAEAGQLLGVDATHIGRYDPDATVTGIASWGRAGAHVPAGTRIPVEGNNVTALVFSTGRPARMDSYDEASGGVAAIVRARGLNSSVGAPIVVDGRLWGVMVASSNAEEPLPFATESRIAAFTELAATAISNTQERAERDRLSDEQAALREVATLVAKGVSRDELFGAVAKQVGRLFQADIAAMARYLGDDTMAIVAPWAAGGTLPPLPRMWSLEGDRMASSIRASRRPIREDDWDSAEGPIAVAAREQLGIRTSVGAPIIVDGEVWGALFVHWTTEKPPPDTTESRLVNFTELVATAVADAQARAEVRRLADEQAALRRVATLVARQPAPYLLFAAVATEIGTLLDVEHSYMYRYDIDGSATIVADWGARDTGGSVGIRQTLEGRNVASLVFATERPARLDDYSAATGEVGDHAGELGVRSAVGAPIVVAGCLWGSIVAASSRPEPLPTGTESRMAEFTELVATAIANTEARTEVRQLADEQAALRRVATLVATEAPATEVFAVVAEELARVLGVEATRIFRYDSDERALLVADWGVTRRTPTVGTSQSLEGDNVARLVLRTGRPARMDDYRNAAGPLADYARRAGLRSLVGAPIIVDGRVWGSMIAATRQVDPLPPDTESRIEQFTNLVATAISNIEARSSLAASRARVVAAADEERRRVVRDLHDGAQQRLVHTIVTLKMARRAVEHQEESAGPLLEEGVQQAESALLELRELARGILPAVLTWGGLPAGVEALASRMPVPVDVDVPLDRLDPAIEASAYFVVAEALTNVAKHARARRATVSAAVAGGRLELAVHDDGVGTADPNGHGLLGLADRLASLDGSLRVVSAPETGTTLTATIPLGR